MQGECFLVNFADDFVAGFQYKSEADGLFADMLGNIVHIKQLLVLAIVADIEVKIALPAQKRCL